VVVVAQGQVDGEPRGREGLERIGQQAVVAGLPFLEGRVAVDQDPRGPGLQGGDGGDDPGEVVGHLHPPMHQVACCGDVGVRQEHPAVGIARPVVARRLAPGQDADPGRQRRGQEAAPGDGG
jgi:hypothetical protein